MILEFPLAKRKELNSYMALHGVLPRQQKRVLKKILTCFSVPDTENLFYEIQWLGQRKVFFLQLYSEHKIPWDCRN